MIKKIIVIGVILLFVGMTFNAANANKIIEEEEATQVEFFNIGSNEKLSKITLQLTEDELTELQYRLSEYFQKTQSVIDIIRLKEIFNDLFDIELPGVFDIIKDFFQIRTSKYGGYVLSFGMGYKFNPFKNNDFSYRKRLSFWHYSSSSIASIPSKTIIVRPLGKDVEVLYGNQIGLMSKFIGIYIYIARKYPQQSISFFVGGAKFIKGYDFLEPETPDLVD
jgi:hypothetical protein